MHLPLTSALAVLLAGYGTASGTPAGVPVGQTEFQRYEMEDGGRIIFYLCRRGEKPGVRFLDNMATRVNRGIVGRSSSGNTRWRVGGRL